MARAPKRPVTVPEYLEWCRAHPDGRYELVAGEIVAMAPERLAHLRTKARVWEALKNAIAAAKLPCEALPDGATVRIDDITAYEPDALVHCEAGLSSDAIEVPAPVIVVEVLSPSTGGRDAGAKLEDYFRVPSVVHYLIVKTERPAVIHHHRKPDGTIVTSIHHGGTLDLDPPGLALALDGLLG